MPRVPRSSGTRKSRPSAPQRSTIGFSPVRSTTRARRGRRRRRARRRRSSSGASPSPSQAQRRLPRACAPAARRVRFRLVAVSGPDARRLERARERAGDRVRRAAHAERAVAARDARREAPAAGQHQRERTRPERVGQLAREPGGSMPSAGSAAAPVTRTESGWSSARPFQLRSRATAASERASAPRPQSVSVGYASSPPARDARDGLRERIATRRRLLHARFLHAATARAAMSRRRCIASKRIRAQAA